jgi:hypothetical protein
MVQRIVPNQNYVESMPYGIWAQWADRTGGDQHLGKGINLQF